MHVLWRERWDEALGGRRIVLWSHQHYDQTEYEYEESAVPGWVGEVSKGQWLLDI